MKHSFDLHISFTTKLIISFLFLPALASSQTGKEITLEDIFKKRIFTATTIQSLPLMNDGKSYVYVKYDNKGIKNKPFEQAYCPNKNHGIYGGNTKNDGFYTKYSIS